MTTVVRESQACQRMKKEVFMGTSLGIISKKSLEFIYQTFLNHFVQTGEDPRQKVSSRDKKDTEWIQGNKQNYE